MFNEDNSVEAYIRDLLSGGLGWDYLPASAVPRESRDALVEPFIHDALIRLNPDIAANPDLAEEVLYRLRAITLSVRSSGLVSANEEMAAWLQGERSMPFGENHQHVSVKLIDFEHLENNQYTVTTQYIFKAGSETRRADLVLLVNGFPLVLIEAKTPVRQAVTWFDGVKQVHDNYEVNVPELFVANVLSVATEGKELRYGAVRMPPYKWGPWHDDESEGRVSGLAEMRRSVEGLLKPEVILDILANFTLFANDQKKRREKVVCRYQQYEAANKIIERVVDGKTRKGLIWHFQGSGKSLAFDEQGVRKVIANINALKEQLEPALQACLAYFPYVDRAVEGYEGLMAAQERLPDNKTRDAFAADYSVLNRLWEALSPDLVLGPLRSDYRWLSQVYDSVRPSNGSGKLLWHTLGAKTIELIHQNVSVDAVDNDLESIVLGEETLGAVLNPTKKAKEVQIEVAKRLRGLAGHPKFKKLSKRLEELKERHEQGLLHSVAFLKALLELARDVLQAEKEESAAEAVVDPGISALTGLFQDAKTDKTPVVVERMVTDVDEVVRQVRFPDWQQTSAGDRLVRQTLRKTLLKYQLHKDQELFEKAYGYIREYY